MHQKDTVETFVTSENSEVIAETALPSTSRNVHGFLIESTEKIRSSGLGDGQGRPKPVGGAAVQSESILTSNLHKPSVLPRPSIYGSRRYTLSVALPSSIVYNAQTMELKTRLVGSIARICAVFNVDEIVVFDDGTLPPRRQQTAHDEERGKKRNWSQQKDEGSGRQNGRGEGAAASGRNQDAFDANSFMAMILQYLETPQYMRRTLFPMHPHLRFAGLLPPLDSPHHLRFEDRSPYREGLVVEEPHWAQQHRDHRNRSNSATAWVNVGHRDPLPCRVSGVQFPSLGTRVTVKMPESGRGQGVLVSPRTPVQSEGLYWGYSVRLAPTLSEIFTNLPFAPESGVGSESAQVEYDLVIGTAERGDALTDVLYATSQGLAVSASKKTSGATEGSATIKPLPSGFHHALILFGGLSGLEVAVEADPAIPLSLEDARELCDFWVDVAEGQGSRTVRTEEALTIALARLKTALEQLGLR